VSRFGVPLWRKNLTSSITGNSEARFIDVDAWGRVVALCYTQAFVDTLQDMIFVVCLDPVDGHEIWRTQVPGRFWCDNLRVYPDRIQYFVSESIGNNQYYQVGHLDYDGNLIAQYRKPYTGTGWYLDYTSLTAEGDILLGNSSGGYTVTKLTPLGDTIWAYYKPSVSGGGRVQGVVGDDAGCAYASGVWGQPGTGMDMVTSKFSTEGKLLWQQVYHQTNDSLWDGGERVCYNDQYVFSFGVSAKTDNYISLTTLVYDRSTGEEVFVILMEKPTSTGYGVRAIEPLADGYYYLGFSYDTLVKGTFNYLGRVRVPDITIGTEVAVQADAGVRAYPNPTKGTLTIEHLDVAKFNRMQVFDPLGRVVLEKVVTQETEHLQIPAGPDGLYQLVLEGKGISITKKVVLAHR
jgi:hypothetical protein